MASAFLLGLGAVVTLACAAAFARAAQLAFEEQALVLGRLRARAGRAGDGAERLARSGLRRRLELSLRRAGLEPSPAGIAFACGALPLVVATALLAAGAAGAVLALCAIGIAAWGTLSWRADRRRRRLLEALPHALEQVMRAVSTGSSLQQAFFGVVPETRGPVREMLERIVRQTRVGVPLEEAFEQTAALWNVRELDMLSFTVRVTQRYGGSVRAALAGIVAALRQRERARRELRALTAETRLSAWVLGCLPLGIALYVSAVNPEYLTRMWDDPTGRLVLAGSLALQGLGGLAIWRLVRAV